MSGHQRKPGQLGPYVGGYRCWLLELGYTLGTVRGQLKVVGPLSPWMADEYSGDSVHPVRGFRTPHVGGARSGRRKGGCPLRITSFDLVVGSLPRASDGR